MWPVCTNTQFAPTEKCFVLQNHRWVLCRGYYRSERVVFLKPAKLSNYLMRIILCKHPRLLASNYLYGGLLFVLSNVSKWRPLLNWITFPTSTSSYNHPKVLFGFRASFEERLPDNVPEGLEPNPDLCQREQVGHIKTVTLWQNTDPVLCGQVLVSGWQQARWNCMRSELSMNRLYGFKSSARFEEKGQATRMTLPSAVFFKWI